MAMTLEEKKKLYDSYLHKSTGFRKIEYNWRDVALYGLAVGAKADEPQYYYEKYLQTIPTFGGLPCYNAINNEPQQPLPHTAFFPLWDDLNRMENGGRRILGLDFDHEIIFHRPIDPIKGTLLHEEIITDIFDRRDKGIAIKTLLSVYNEAGVLLCENIGTAALMGGGNFGGDPFPSSKVVFPDRDPDITEDDYLSPVQHALYRLTGDTNLMHVDDEYARNLGMDGAIMQGFCPMGFACRMLVNHLIAKKPELAKRIKVQFRSVCYPDTNVQLQAWKIKKGLVWFRLMNLKTGKPVLDKGEFEYIAP